MEEAAGQFPRKELLDDVPTVEDERDELEDPEFEVEVLPLEAEKGADLGRRCPGTAEAEAEADRRRKPAGPGRAQARRQRTASGRLEKLQEEKELFIQKTRAELRACRRRLDLVTKQQASVAAQVAAGREADNTAAVGRLQAVSRRLCTELDNEKDVQSKLTALLQESERAIWHLEIQKGQLKDVPKFAQEEEAAARKCLQTHGATQPPREEGALRKVERSRLLRLRKATYLQKEHGLRHQKLLEDAKKNHKVAVKFLRASLGRVRAQQREEERASRQHMQRRMDAVLALKNSITANRETLRKFQAWGQARVELAEQKAQAEKEMILAQGGDTFKYLFHQRRRQELEARNRAFAEQQRLRKQEIVARILKEGAEEENRRRKQSSPTKATGQLTRRDKTWGYISDVCEDRDTVALPSNLLDSEAVTYPRASQLLGAVSYESIHGDPGSITWEEDTLAEPEVPGLWKEDYNPRQVAEDEADRKPVGGTKMDRDILARTMEQLRSRVTHRQVASGHEFKGRPFNSKPELIHFKDFDIGKVYKKKITLINATYTINYCELLGVEEQLRDFIRVDFDPPGPMSAGMSCEVLVTFKPMINKDLEGSVLFLAQTGRFSVPLKCSTKKCASSLFTDEDKGIYSKITTSFSEQQIEGSESLTTDVTSQKESGKLGSKEQEEGRPAESEGVTMATVMTVTPNEEQTEISLGEVTEGEIGPFSSIKVPVIFTPIIPGTTHTKFKVVFKNKQCPTLHFRVMGVAVDVPVWVPRPHVDLKICMYDRLYQDSILVHTRSTAALRLRFEVCKALRGHVELLPETGYIQARSSFSVQLKFLPRLSLPEDAGKYFDQESRVLEAPMTIWVADQTKPVGFTVHAVVTTSDLALSPTALDFGHCTIHEAVRAHVSLHNLSLLPQGFGFVGLPKFVDIQPNDGFGTILPLETLQLDVLFRPDSAKDYRFELTCKSEINRCFKLACRAVGVRPPLELSHYQVKFAATSLYDTSVATLYVVNSHVSMNSLTHSVPRIGSQDASPVGPTSFEFLPPPDSPITISPLVGTVLPGKRCLVQVAFRPVLPTKLILQEAFQALTKEAEAKSPHRSTGTQRKDLARQSSMLQLQSQDHPPLASTAQEAELQRLDLKPSSDEYQAAQATLARSFPGSFDKFVVPCVVASGDTADRKGMEPLSFSPHNTLHLELWCPAVAPSLVVASNKGKTIFNFGAVAVGHCGIKKVSIQNISPEDLTVEFSVLNPNGSFILLNPISKLLAGETQVLTLSFSPRESIPAQETLDIITKRGTLSLTLMGTGVASVVTCSVEGNILDMGYVIARESVSSSFKLQNGSALPIRFSMRLDSLSSTRSQSQQRLPKFLTSAAQRTEVVDHESRYFSDRLQVLLFGKKISHQILLKGAAREHMMFVEGGDPLDVPVESLTGIPTCNSERREEAEELKFILVTLDYIQPDTDMPAPPATRELQVGCIRTTQLSPKKLDQPLMVSALLQLKGDVKETYKVFFVAQVVTGP
uniref:Cilia and flagella associated protein 74 n=1 Tax=Suricata suricatta TaxID=37032 RepID=A0A673U735_SURSU